MAEPMYRQIAEELRAQIESGELTPGSQLPTELELRDRYEASRNTIRDALRWLTVRGLIVARAGQGTFVSRRAAPFITTLSSQEAAGELANSGERYSASPSRVGVETAGQLARMLRLPPETEVVSRQQVRYIDGVPWSLQTSFYPRELVTRGAELLLTTVAIPAGTLAYLKETLGFYEAGYEDLIQVGPPNEEEARLLKLPNDGSISVITVLRTSYTTNLDPFMVTITVFPADRNQLRVTWGNAPAQEEPSEASDY